MRQTSRHRLCVARIIAILAAVAAAATAFPSPASAAEDPSNGPRWFDLYQKAGVHAELEDWEAVDSYIRQAIALNPDPQRNVRIYGMWHASYMPYFYLGLSQYRLGRYDEAMDSFRKEEAAGVIQHDPVAWLKMKKLMASAHGTPPRPQAPARPAGSGGSALETDPQGDPVITGLEAFFKNDYDGSIAAFQDAMKAGRDDDLTLHLYLGMAYAGKASSGGADGKIWENLAFLEFQRVHALDPGYRLSSGIFSEEMMSLFERAGGRE